MMRDGVSTILRQTCMLLLPKAGDSIINSVVFHYLAF